MYVFDSVSEELLPVIDGIVAGDGHLTRIQNIDGRDGVALILGLGLKQGGFAEEFAERIKSFGFTGTVAYYATSARVVWRSVMFREQRLRWYPNDIKKLPIDISNKPEMWRWLYAGDGTIRQCSAYGSKIGIHVESFIPEDIERLAFMLSFYNVKAWPTKSIISKVSGKRLFSLQISTHSTKDFLDMIGPPVRSLEYKWDIPAPEQRSCLWCSSVFLPTRVDAVYCCNKCGIKANHPAYSTDPTVLLKHRKMRREYERDRRALIPECKPRPNVWL